MKRPRSQPVVSAALLVVVGALSLHSAADVTMAAVLLNAGRQITVRGDEGESFGQWLSRLTDSARQMRNVFGGGEGTTIATAHAAAPWSASLGDLQDCVGVLPLERQQPRGLRVMRPALTDLPPPLL